MKLLKELRPQKAPDGPDCITAIILKACAEQVAPLLQLILQKSLDTGELLSDWHKADVSPNFKTGNISHHANYRPVSLTSIPCKMLEHIIHINIMRYLEKYKVLNDEQHGFHRGRSCETQLALSVNDLAKVLDRQRQADVVIMFLAKLLTLYLIIDFFQNSATLGSLGDCTTGSKFFNNENTAGDLEGVSSSSITVTSDVPQSMVLVPILFIIYLNDLPEGISSQVRFLADNCILYWEIHTLNHYQDLQKAIDTLCNWESK